MGAGVADDDIDTDERHDGLINQPRDLGRIADISGKAAHSRNFGSGSVKLGFAPACDRNLAALSREFGGNGEAHPAAADGDESHFIREAAVHDADLTEDVAVVTAVNADRATGDETRAVGNQERD